MRPVASLEPHRGADAVCTLRVHDAGAAAGGPYAWACTAVLRGDEARLFGALATPTPAQWRAIAEVLREHGMRRVTWERRTKRGVRNVLVELNQTHP